MVRLISFFCALLLFSTLGYANSTPVKASSYLDASSKESLSDIKSKTFQPEESPKKILFGFTASTLWLKLVIDEPTLEELVLDIDYPLLDSVTLFFEKNGSWESMLIGDQVRGWERKYNAASLHLEIPKNAGNTFYLKVKSESSLTVPISIKTIDEFYVDSSNNLIFYFLYYGALLAMLIYNFFLYSSLRSRSYLIYCLTILFTILYQANYNGHAQLYFWGNSLYWSNLAMPFFMGLAALFSAEFAITFLDLKKKPKILVRTISAIGLITLILSLTSPYNIAIKSATFATLFGSLVLFSVGLHAWIRGQKIASYYTVAWSIYLFFLIMGALRAFGVLPSNFITYKSSHFGSLFEIVVLAYALAYKYKLINDEKVKYQEELNESQFQLNLRLDKKVNERTVELEKALDEKGLMMAEIHHRVKNNLQLITSMLNLHIRKLDDQSAIEALEESKRRIDVMSDLHEQLYSETSDLLNLNIEDYLERLIELVSKSYSETSITIKSTTKVDFSLSFDKTILLGLLMNEIISNSFKHGFKEKSKGLIQVELASLENQIEIRVTDNGTGLPSEFSAETHGSLGMRIINALAKQLGGSYRIENNEPEGVQNTFRIKTN